jgi:glutamyl-tRNA reductase
MDLVGCELKLESPGIREAVVKDLRRPGSGAFMILDTCQRLECYGTTVPAPAGAHVARVWSGPEAFERLARIAAGLESRVLGELEVLGQVREAYRLFREQTGGNDAALDRILQDILAVARKARRDSRIDQTLISLAALAAETLLECATPGAPIAVIGSGALASSVTRRLADRGGAALRIAGRCPKNALRLASEVQGFGVGLDDLTPMMDGVAGIVAATAAPHPVLYAHHLEKAARPLVIVDLGVPPDCSEETRELPGVTYIPLGQVEARTQINLDERRRHAETAAQIVREGAREWAATHRDGARK